MIKIEYKKLCDLNLSKLFCDIFIFALFSTLVACWVLLDSKDILYATIISIPFCFLAIILCYHRINSDNTQKSLLWFILGFCLLLLFSYHENENINKNLETTMITIAGSLLSLGLIGVILQLKDTKDYFAEALSALVIEESYIKKLNHEQLKKLQKKILERIFENNGELDRENSFYKFYNRKIESFIGQPYRENFHNTVAISETKRTPESIGGYRSNEKKYLIDDTVSYQCRTMGSRLNTNVKWVASKDEIDELIEFSVYINQNKLFDISLLPKNQEEIDEFSLENGVVITKFHGVNKSKGGIDFHLDFSNYKKGKSDIVKDGCIIKVHAVYIATNFKTIAAKLLEPTKDYTLTVTHPNNLKNKVEVYGYETNSKYYEHRDYTGGFSLSFRSWLLPESGVYIAFEEQELISSSENIKNEVSHHE